MRPDLYAEALADLRAITPKPDEAIEPGPQSPDGCCTGDRRGYQWHQRTGNLPACDAATRANTEYGVPYHREWRRRKRMESDR